jgi:transcriptional regulator with XRE-family HTH domain
VVAGSNPATPTFPVLTKKRGEVVNTSSLLQELSKAQAILKLSDRAVAQKIGVSNAYISLIKRGERRLTPAILQKIIAILPDLQSTSMSSLNFSTRVFAYTTIADMRLIGKTSLKPLFDEFLVAKQVEGKSTATLDFYRQNLERFLWWAQQNNVPQEVQKIQVRDLRSFLYYVQITPNRWQIGSTSSRHLPSMATVDAYWRTLQGFFSWLVNEGNIKSEANPMRKLPRPKVPRKIVQDIPLNLIRQALDQWDKNTLTGARNRAILLMLLDTGIRLSECANLTTADINLEHGG